MAILLAALRTGYTLYERHAETLEPTRKQPPPLNPDYYVVPKKLYAYDLKSAKQLTQQPVWVKVGYSSTYYRYDPKSRHADFAHPAGQLLPLEELKIKDVVNDLAPSAPDQRQVMAIFEKDGKTAAFSIGSVKGDTYKIYSDDMLYLQDPHELYRHWAPDIWAAIDQHEVKTGMNELQADFAIGLGIPESSGESEEKTVNYSNGGRPLSVTYRKGKAVAVRPGS